MTTQTNYNLNSIPTNLSTLNFHLKFSVNKVNKYLFSLMFSFFILISMNICNCSMGRSPFDINTSSSGNLSDENDSDNISITKFSFADSFIVNNHVILDYNNPGNITNNSVTFTTRSVEFPVIYSWSIVKKPDNSSPAISNENSSSTTITIDANGLYVIVLYVCDNEGNGKTEYAYINTLSTLKYVRADATGTNDGSDWTNAYTNLPSSLLRGYVYYIASGTYSGYTFDDTESDNLYITIRRATTTDHGVSTGWDTSYDNSVQFGACSIVRDRYFFDGNKVKYGIKFYSTADVIYFHGPSSWDTNYPQYINFEYCEISSVRRNPNDSDLVRSYSSIADDYGPQYLTFRHCYLHDACRMIINTTAINYWLVEYCKFARNYSTAAYHAEGWQAQGGHNVVFRYNIMENIMGTCFIAIKKNSNRDHNNWKIYGNIFYNTSSDYSIGGNGIIGCSSGGTTNTSTTSNILVYNNTFYNIHSLNPGIYLRENSDGGTYFGNCVYNNIWVGCTGSFTHTGLEDCNYNDYYNTTYSNGNSNENIYASGNPFVNAPDDFNIIAASAGKTLDSEFSIDRNGNKRGSDGTWDTGVFEF